MADEFDAQRLLREKAETRFVSIETALEEMRREMKAWREAEQQRSAPDMQIALQRATEEMKVAQQRAVAAEAALAAMTATAEAKTEERQTSAASGQTTVIEVKQEDPKDANAETSSSTPRPNLITDMRMEDEEMGAGGTLQFAMTCDLVPDFSADDPTQPLEDWLQRIAENANRHNWTEDEVLIAAKRALTGTARRWLSSQQKITSWEQMKVGLEAMFGHLLPSIDVEGTMRRRKRRDGEVLADYVREMEHLGEQGGLSTHQVRYYIGRGITEDARIRVALLDASCRAEFLQTLEYFYRKTNGFIARSEPTRSPWRVQVEHDSRRTKKTCLKEPEYLQKKSNKQCYICKQSGHLKFACPQRSLVGGGKITRARASAYRALVDGAKVKCQVGSKCDKSSVRVCTTIKAENCGLEMVERTEMLCSTGGPNSNAVKSEVKSENKE